MTPPRDLRMAVAPVGTPPPGAPGSEGQWRELGEACGFEVHEWQENVLLLAGGSPFASSAEDAAKALRELHKTTTVRLRFTLPRSSLRAWRRALHGPWPYASPRRDPLGSGRVAAKRRRQLATELRRRDRRAARRG